MFNWQINYLTLYMKMEQSAFIYFYMKIILYIVKFNIKKNLTKNRLLLLIKKFLVTFIYFLIIICHFLGLGTKMKGRKPNVKQEEIIKLIEKYISHFTTNDFPPLGDAL